MHPIVWLITLTSFIGLVILNSIFEPNRTYTQWFIENSIRDELWEYHGPLKEYQKSNQK